MARLTEHKLPLNFRLPHKPNDWPRLFAMTDAARSPDPFELIDRLPPGSGLVFRHYDIPNRRRVAKAVIKKCRARRIHCFIAGDVKVALAIGADGVHLPEHQLYRRPFGLGTFRLRGGRVTAATHSLPALIAAQKLGVGGVFISPVFSTRSHPDTRPLGVYRFARLAMFLNQRAYALGGQKIQTAKRVLHAGAYGVAGISLFKSE